MITFSKNFKFKNLALQCIDELENLGDDFIIKQDIFFDNFKGMSKGGDCYKISRFNYRIRVNQDLISEDEIKCVIIHEILHSYPACMRHTGEWKRRAECVNERLGYEIERTISMSLSAVSHHYEIKCKKCGAKAIYYNRSKAVKYFEENPNGNRYSCCKCGNNKFDFKEVI